MSCRRSMSIIARTKLFYQQQQRLTSSEIRSRFPMSRNNAGSSLLSGNVSGLMRSNIPAGHGLLFHRNYSEVPSDFEVLYDGGGDLNGVMGAVGDKAVEAAAPVVNEAAVAAADSGFQYLIYNADFLVPVAACKYLIDYVHCCTGFEWWASIAATALLIRLIQLPILIKEMKLLEGYTRTIRDPLLKELHEWKSRNEPFDPKKNRAMIIRIKETMLQSPTGYKLPTAIGGTLFLSVLNMAEKVPSFATGGTLWFMDLTTPDHSMRLPILFALTLWLRRMLDPRTILLKSDYPGPYGKIGDTGGVVTAGIALLASAASTGLPSAIFCYGITSNLFTVASSIVLMDPRVRKLLGVSVKPSSTDKKT